MTTRESGAIALLTMLIVAAGTLVLVTNGSLLTLGDLDVGYTIGQSGATRAMTEGCIDETLRRIRLDTNYGVGAGTIPLSVTGGSCNIDVTAAGSARTIIAEGTYGDYTQRYQADISLSGTTITMDDWQELDS